MDIYKSMPANMADSVAALWLDTMAKSHSYIDYSYIQQKSEIIKNGLLKDIDTLICMRGDEIAGFIMISADNRIESITVGKKYRNNGIGTHLLKYAQSRYSVLHMNIYARSKDSLKFYSRHGFLIDGAFLNRKTRLVEYTLMWCAQ